MEDKKSELHPLLEKQLKRLNVNLDTPPVNIEQWHEFLSKISRSYYNDEQELYLLERSNEISSREMRELSEKLEDAQTIAHLGYWLYNRDEDKIIWSKETYRLFGIDPIIGAPKYKDVIQLIHPADRERLEELIKRSFEEDKDFEIVIRMRKKSEKTLNWSYILGRPYRPKSHQTAAIRYISGIIMDITATKNAELEMLDLYNKLLITARQVGMSEVATSILHNVGNILNSINISISLIRESFKNNHLKNLIKTATMIKEEVAKKTDYLSNDPKGKLIPDYLVSLSTLLNAESTEIEQEIRNLDTNIQHIKDIVVMQRDLSGLSGIIEDVHLPELLDTALQMANAGDLAKNIEIKKIYNNTDPIKIDKAKLIQILVNLIRNAVDSLISSKQIDPKIISILLKKLPDNKFIEIAIQDNGVGVPPDDQVKIFSFGYTTKKTGHGFGLHSCSIAAKELGGNIRVASEGVGKGASFIIHIPIDPSLVEKSGP